MRQPDCVFCNPTGEAVLWSDAHCRVLHLADAKFPGFCRVVWNAHVTEFTDLDEAARAHVMKVVAVVEQALRRLLAPDKINLASLGNQTPHLHWHIIPRYRDDAHFPDPIWAAAKRGGVVRELPKDFGSSVRKALEVALR